MAEVQIHNIEKPKTALIASECFIRNANEIRGRTMRPKKYMRFSNKCEVVIKIWGFFVSFQVIVGGFAGFRINEYLLFDGAFHENGIFHLTTQFDWN